MSQEPTRKNKRKSMGGDATASGSGSGSGVKVSVLEPSASAGPVFVNFPSVRPAKSTPFTIYARDAGSTDPLPKQETILAGETEDVEYFSTNRLTRAWVEGNDCQYLPAVYDKEKGTLVIHPSAPLYLMSHRAKRLRQAALTNASMKDDYRARRNDLGEVFGTRKAKTMIRAEERNKIDVNAMQGVKGHLMETIGESSVVEGVIPPPELIPKPNLSTSNLALVYPRESLLSDGEWQSIDASSINKAGDDKARMGLLPYRRSRFVEEKLRLACESSMSSSEKKTIIRLSYYLATLHAFNDLSSRLSKLDTQGMLDKLPGCPTQLLNGLLTRFAEKSGKKYTSTEKTKTKLLAWMCTVYLHLDGFSVSVERVAKELNLAPGKIVDIFKSLGCKVDLPTTAEREKAGMSLADAKTNKRAVLKAPVTYPKPKSRGPVKR